MSRATRRPRAGPDDDAVILFTSGTSARPKGVVLNYREHLGNIDPTADGFGITADDRVYDFRSFNWASAQLLGRAGAGQPRRHPGHDGEILRQPLLPAHPRSRRDDRRRQSDHDQHPAQHRDRCATEQSAVTSLHHLELGAADDRRMAPVRGAVRHSDRAGLWIQRDRLDCGHSRRATAPRHGRSAIRLSLPRGRRCRRPTAAARPDRPGRNRRRRIARLPLSRRRRQREDRQPRPHPHRRPGAARCRRFSQPDRTREGPHHSRRREHFADRDRRLPDAAPRADRGRHRRRAGRDLRRGSGELRGGAPGRNGRYRRAPALLQRGAAGIQGAEADRAQRLAAQDRARQAQPAGAGGTVAKGNGE